MAENYPPQQEADSRNESRHRVLSTAARLMKQRGIKPVTMSEIAVESGMSKRTIYEMFEDKMAMVKAVMLENFAGYPPDWVRETENPLERLLAAMLWGTREFFSFNCQFFCDMQRCYPAVWKEYSETVNRQRHEKTVKLMQRGAQEHLLLPDLDYDLMARILLGLGHYIRNEEVFPPEKYAIDYVSWEMQQLFVRGIATREGKKVLDEYMQNPNIQRLQ